MDDKSSRNLHRLDDPMIENAHPTPEARVFEAYLNSVLTGDRSEALRVIREDAFAANISIQRIYLGVIQATQYELGRLWEEGTITVAQEHLATGISQLAIAYLYSMTPGPDSSDYRVLISCVPGESHDMGARILADFLEMDGFEVRFLGADVPTSDIVDAVRRYEPDIVALSVTMSYNLPGLRDTVAALRKEFGRDIRIAAGGVALRSEPELLDDLGISILAADARLAIDSARQALGKP